MFRRKSRRRFERGDWRVDGVLASFPFLVAVVGAMIAVLATVDETARGLVFFMIA